MKKYLYLNSRDELYKIDIAKIVYFEAEGNYTNFYLSNKLKGAVCMNLAQMKKLINKYSKVNYDASVMKKLKKYDKNYFKNKALCISTVNQQENETVSVGSVKKIMKANGKYTIKVSLNSKHISDAPVKKDKASYNIVVEISKTAAGLSDKVVVK